MIAGEAARLAVHKTVLADADLVGSVAQAAELVALAIVFRHFALHAAEFCVACSERHIANLAPSGVVGNIPLVTGGELSILDFDL